MFRKCIFQEVKFIPKLAINTSKVITSTNIHLYSIKQPFFLISVISRGSSPGLSCTSSAALQIPRHLNGSSSNGCGTPNDPVYSRINKSNSSSLIKESASSSPGCAGNVDVEWASLTWLQKQQKKLEERRARQQRRDGPHFANSSHGKCFIIG